MLTRQEGRSVGASQEKGADNERGGNRAQCYSYRGREVSYRSRFNIPMRANPEALAQKWCARVTSPAQTSRPEKAEPSVKANSRKTNSPASTGLFLP